jgi:hypothetical protein
VNTVSVKNHGRILQFENLEQGEPIESRCSLCGRVFIGEFRGNERTDNVLLRMRADFEAHDCHKEVSQA